MNVHDQGFKNLSSFQRVGDTQIYSSWLHNKTLASKAVGPIG